MLKDAIRQFASNMENRGGQLQLAGVSVAEQKALLGELKDKADKKENYKLAYWV